MFSVGICYSTNRCDLRNDALKHFVTFGLAAILLAVGCVDQEKQSEADVAEAGSTDTIASDAPTALAAEDVVANNVIIDHDGSTRALGAFKIAFGQTDPETGEKVFTREFGAPVLAGPTVVYVFKSIRAEDFDSLSQHGVKVEENTAYLLPTGVDAFSDINAFKEMQRIGPIDPALSDDELGALFGLSEE